MTLMKQKTKSSKNYKNKRGTYIIEVDEPVFDIDYSQPAEREFKQLMDFHYLVKQIILDFSKVEEITTSGSGIILAMYLKCTKKEINIKIVNLNHYISETLDELGFLNLFNLNNK